MSREYEKLQQCYQSIAQKLPFRPKVALVLGSGLGNFADRIRTVYTLDYHAIEGFPVSTVEGHAGRYVFGYIGEVPVVCMQGRVHYYEGYTMQEVVLPIRLMHQMGAKILLLTNASGGIAQGMQAGDLMLITDHIATFVPNPLIGPNLEPGVRFPDMSHVYDPVLSDVIRSVAKEQQILLQEGVYIQFTGPSYETPAEVKMAGILGADAVGMSTAVEAIAAVHFGMRVCGISCVCNPAAGISKVPLSHKEVQEAANEAAPKFKKLVTESVIRFGEV